jgi:hypothetical protein
MERDTPANPNAGKALLRRLRLEERFGTAQNSLLGYIEPIAHKDTRSTLSMAALFSFVSLLSDGKILARESDERLQPRP